jgi:NADH-ubiquinone oxidoreductase chain 6
MTIYVLSEVFSGFLYQFLDLLSIISILLGIFIIVSKNPIISVLFLIMLFSSISVYLILLGAKFIGISYLLVYVGAVSILFLFILMLINIRVSELISDTNNNIPLAILTILAFINPINHILPDQNVRYDSFIDIIFKGELNKLSDYLTDNNQISYVSSKSWDGNITDSVDIMTIGNILYTSYSAWLIISSIILLLAMVGAIVITVKQKDV